MTTTAPLRWLAGQTLSVPVYGVYEGAVRLVNSGARPLRPELRAAVEPYATDVDLDRVRLREDAHVAAGYSGITFDHTVFVNRRLDPDVREDIALLIHELVHVRQAARWGHWGMARRYGLAWVMSLSYRDHPLEVEARRVTAHAMARWDQQRSTGAV